MGLLEFFSRLFQANIPLTRTSSYHACAHSSSYVILDTETTGLDPFSDKIIQISAIKYNPDGAPVDFFDTYINPGIPIPPNITKINHITDRKVAKAPTAEQIQEQFLTFLDTSLIVGYNTAFDLRFLNRTFLDLFIGRSYVDVLAISKQFFDLPNYKLQTVSSAVGFYPDGWFHDAFSDCEAVAAILHHLSEPGLLQDFTKQFYMSKERRDWETAVIRDIPQDPYRPKSNKAFQSALACWDRGEVARKNGNIEEAIRLFDEARRLGLTYPYVYISYAKIYRKQKDYEKEIAVLEEAISRFSPEMDEGLVERKSRVLALLSAQQDRERELQQKEEKRAQRAEARKRAEELKALRPKQPVKRAVLQCNDDGSILNEFESVAAAAAYCGISTKCIRDAANGRQKHAGGFCWRYAEPTSTEDESI